MTNLGTTILADEQLQNIVDPFDLFHKPETDPHHIDSKWVTARPKLHLPEDDGPIYIEVHNFDGNYHDTSTWCLQTEFDVIALHKENTPKTTDSDLVSLINNFPASLWKKITLFVNGVEVTHNTSTNYAYKTWFDVMASFSPEVKKYRLEDGGSYFFQPESINDFEKYQKSATEDKYVFDKIHEAIIKKGGGVCRSELYIDALNVHKYFIHENEIKIELIRNSDDFLLMYDPATLVNGTNQKYAIKFKKIELHYKIIKPSIEMKEHHDKLLGEGRYAMIPFSQTELSHRLIHPRSSNYQLFRIANGPVIPRKIFVMFVEHNNFIGKANLNPFQFKNLNIKDITFKWHTRSFPADRYNMNWKPAKEQGLLEAYHHFMDAIGIKNGNATNGISLKKFIEFFPVFVFDRAPDACNGVHTHIPEQGVIDLEFELNEPLTGDPIVAIFYSQYDKILTWHRIPGKIEFPPEVNVINNFSVQSKVKEESVDL